MRTATHRLLCESQVPLPRQSAAGMRGGGAGDTEEVGEDALRRSRHAPAPSRARGLGTKESALSPDALYPWLDESEEAAPRTRTSAAAAPFARAAARASAAQDVGSQVQGGASAARAGGGAEGGARAGARLELVINTDGASRGNPGAAAYGVRSLCLLAEIDPNPCGLGCLALSQCIWSHQSGQPGIFLHQKLRIYAADQACQGRFYVLIQIAEFAIGKSIIDFHTIRIRANRERFAPFQHDLRP